MAGVIYRISSGEVLVVTSDEVAQSFPELAPELATLDVGNVSNLPTIPIPGMIVDSGAIRASTQIERDGFAADRQSDANKSHKREIKAVFRKQRVWLAFAQILFKEINALRVNAGLSLRTKNQFMSALDAEVDATTVNTRTAI